MEAHFLIPVETTTRGVGGVPWASQAECGADKDDFIHPKLRS